MSNEQKTYHIDGFSCANCAKTFEKNVKDIRSVEDAEVNFGASKITITGDATVQEIEKAGAFEKLKVIDKNQPKIKEQSFLKKHGEVLASALFMLLGFILVIGSGGQTSMTTGVFLISIVIGGYRMFWTGINNLSKLRFDMKTLMTIAVIGAALIGEWPEAAVVVVLFAVSESLERYSMEKARASIQSLMEIVPRTAAVKTSGGIKEIPVEEVDIGDIIVIRPGDKLSMDGIIRYGSTSINQAAITGESLPVEKLEGDDVFAGTLNESGYLEVEVTKHNEDTTLAKIIQLVEEAQGERAPAQHFVDQFAKYYTPAIMIAALLVAIVPPVFFGAAWSSWVYQGLAVLVVGCPCALVISTPIAIVSAIGNAAKKGVLIKGGIYLEKIGHSKTIAFDKTGTLTEGRPHVTDFVTYDGRSRESVLAIASAMEAKSEHPLASSIIEYAASEGIDDTDVHIQKFNAETGTGITGIIEGKIYSIGKPGNFEDASGYQADGKTVMVVKENDKVIGLFAVTDQLRSSSKAAVEKLHKMGTRTVMLTGDNTQTAGSIAKTLGIDKVYAELMPEDKLNAVKEMKSLHKVAMVGDGINDAPALAAADIGIAMGKGTDTALETADVALMGNDISQLPFTVSLSKRALRIIKANITFSLVIKLIALLLVIPGWLTLWIAILSDIGATLVVALNGMRLLRMKE
ncbi:heavy metal translocating P-type ATPase [Salinicoccus halodurans]|uniref:Cd(2+)-exporting ATPase n=1 Tax=Salinicoccus halodurans TaxID=407035 RepID=A0A0F7HLM6_9STAP|nr:heavy metal translocating P-type ATPase [Salinicoccus halodurans]AKG74864.1 cadmium transporter [Salinicoccus halodurans]SFK69285.1 Cd2+/Zn2+-exporting ATPase [Salinicoccus halodurans]